MQGFVVVYSITSAPSFEAAQKLRTSILRIKEDTPDVSINTIPLPGESEPACAQLPSVQV